MTLLSLITNEIIPAKPALVDFSFLLLINETCDKFMILFLTICLLLSYFLLADVSCREIIE